MRCRFRWCFAEHCAVVARKVAQVPKTVIESGRFYEQPMLAG